MTELIISEGTEAMERVQQLVSGFGIIHRIHDELKKIVLKEASTYGHVDVRVTLVRASERMGSDYVLKVATVYPATGRPTNEGKTYQIRLKRNRVGLIDGVA